VAWKGTGLRTGEEEVVAATAASGGAATDAKWPAATCVGEPLFGERSECIAVAAAVLESARRCTADGGSGGRALARCCGEWLSWPCSKVDARRDEGGDRTVEGVDAGIMRLAGTAAG